MLIVKAHSTPGHNQRTTSKLTCPILFITACPICPCTMLCLIYSQITSTRRQQCKPDGFQVNLSFVYFNHSEGEALHKCLVQGYCKRTCWLIFTEPL